MVAPIKTSLYKLTIDTNRKGIPLASLFTDLDAGSSLAIPASDDAPNVVSKMTGKYICYLMTWKISIQYHCGPDVTILASKTSFKYRIQSSHFEAMWLILSELIQRLANYWKDRGAKEVKDPKDAATKVDPLHVTYSDELPFQVLAKFLAVFLFITFFLGILCVD